MSPRLRSLIQSFIAAILLGISVSGFAQPNSYPYKVAQDRMIWHDKVDQAQHQLFLMGGGKEDSVIHLSKDETVNLQITDALGRRTDDLQQQIEFDSTLNTNAKKRYLRGLESLLNGFGRAYR